MHKLDTHTIDHIQQTLDNGIPHIGIEDEGIAVDATTFEVIHRINGVQTTQAVKRALEEILPEDFPITKYITPDVPETIVETNPPPFRSPRSAVAAQRLFDIIIDKVCRNLGEATDRNIQLLHGASLRPPFLTEDDASEHIDPFKRFYYQYQIAQHGDKVGAAAGSHLNISSPWIDNRNPVEVTRKMIEMTGRMRLLASPLAIGLSASSPLYYGANGGNGVTEYQTILTPFNSARLARVWPGRTIMDVADLYHSPSSFQRTLKMYAKYGVLKSGRDIWLPVRPQAGSVKLDKEFSQICHELGIDINASGSTKLIKRMLNSSFQHGPQDNFQPFNSSSTWRKIEKWRQHMLSKIIKAPRTRVELRMFETPPAFDEQTPYKYLKAIHSFFELVYIYLSENPDSVVNLEYNGVTLQAAKNNEQRVLTEGLDAEIYWVPKMTATTPRETIATFLDEVDDLAHALQRDEDFELIRQIINGEILPPAERIRREIADWYQINIEARHNDRFLPDDSYPIHLLERTRNMMETETSEISSDFPGLPDDDKPFIRLLLNLVNQINS